MSGPALRWKEHSLFPYTCAGCKTRHEKGEGVYLDQSGPRTKVYDSPQCADVTPKQPAPSPSTPSDGNGRTHPSKLTLTVSLQGKDLEVTLKGQDVEKVTMERFVQELSRLIMDDLS